MKLAKGMKYGICPGIQGRLLKAIHLMAPTCDLNLITKVPSARRGSSGEICPV